MRDACFRILPSPPRPDRRAAAAIRIAGVLLCLLTASALLIGCGRPVEPVRGQFMVFGTRVEVLIRSSDQALARTGLRDLGEAFQRMHTDWHPWQSGALSELNAALASGERARPGPELLGMIRDAQRLERDSLGYFNAAIGRLVALWGFHTSDYPIQAPLPEEGQIDVWLRQAPSALDIEIQDQEVFSLNDAVQLDFSGMAKGLAGRLACERLTALGLEDALVNLGGDVMVCGPAATPWIVAISDGQGGVYSTLRVEQGPLAIFSSGTAQRWGEWEGERYAHLLDPRTGRALTHAIQATVIDPDPVLADAAATAMAIAGAEDWQRVAGALQTEAVLLLDGSGEIAIDLAFQAYLAEP
jgi:thiamine biosynthesis lipoprotein